MTLDGGMVFEAGRDPYKLRPVAAEIYGTKECEFSLGTQKLRWPGPGPWALWGQSGQGTELRSQTVSHVQGMMSLGSLGWSPTHWGSRGGAGLQ